MTFHATQFMRIFRLVILAAGVVFAAQMVTAGESSSGRYVNPLSIEGTRSVADPTIVRWHDKYYMYLTGGMVWVSDDLITWKHEQAAMPAGQRSPTAPNFFEYDGSVYLSG